MTKLITLAFISLIMLDYITGLSQAVINKELSSRIARDGLIRSANEVIVLGIIFYGTTLYPDITPVYVTFVTGFLIKELISVLENLRLMGVTYLDSILKFLKDKENNGDN